MLQPPNTLLEPLPLHLRLGLLSPKGLAVVLMTSYTQPTTESLCLAPDRLSHLVAEDATDQHQRARAFREDVVVPERAGPGLCLGVLGSRKARAQPFEIADRRSPGVRSHQIWRKTGPPR